MSRSSTATAAPGVGKTSSSLSLSENLLRNSLGHARIGNAASSITAARARAAVCEIASGAALGFAAAHAVFASGVALVFDAAHYIGWVVGAEGFGVRDALTYEKVLVVDHDL